MELRLERLVAQLDCVGDLHVQTAEEEVELPVNRIRGKEDMVYLVIGHGRAFDAAILTFLCLTRAVIKTYNQGMWTCV